MKNIIIVLVFSLVVVFPIVANAAPSCSTTSAGIPDEPGEPACYTSSSSTSSWTTTEFSHYNCVWYDSGLNYCKNDAGTAAYRTSASSCPSGWYIYWAPVVYNTCGGSTCGNMNGTHVGEGWDPVYKNVNHSSTTTTFTCHYLIVDKWGECDPDSGKQVADDVDYKTVNVTQAQANGMYCENLNEDTTRDCGVCNSNFNGVGSGDAPSPTPPETLCTWGYVSPDPPILNKSTNEWEWACEGTENIRNGDVVVASEIVSYKDYEECTAPNEEDGECNTTYNNKVIDSPGLNGTEDLCTGGTVANFVAETTEGPWTWDCMKIGDNIAHHDKKCGAKCFDFTAVVDPNPFQWPTDGSTVEVDISLEKHGMCQGKYSCTVDGETFEITPIVKEVQDSSDLNIASECKSTDPTDPPIPPTDPISAANSYCTARACNAQGTCQATPVTAAAYNSTVCTSSCSSNADCSSGRMIETKP